MSLPTQSQCPDNAAQLAALQRRVLRCARCPRLVRWRQKVAHDKVARFSNDSYWGKPVPGFGDPNARLLILGLAPAAHGGNRTGRMFTGDRSGDWLYRALYKSGFANQPTSVSRDDGLKLHNCYITASARCAPPLNKLSPQELKNCRPFLNRELEILGIVEPSPQRRVVLVLGKVAFDTFLSVFSDVAGALPKPRPQFAHGAEFQITPSMTLLASFHPSQQNTFTRKLTEPMLDAIFARARQILA